jgi:glyoxylase-like metal-dependent hydrolase (beta-lactamase superfamily II)
MDQKRELAGANGGAEGARWAFKHLRAATFRLDGGSMFGLIPRVVWGKSVPTDEKGRIAVQHNCLLLERRGNGDGPRRVLIETGTGNKLDDKMREVFALEDRWVDDALREAGLARGCEDVDAVVVTHLHFDHAGALTRLARAGERVDWACGPGEDGGGGSARVGGCVRSFPNAQVYVQRREWRDAIANRSVMTKTYYPDHLLPVEGQVRLVESSPPFAPGYVPDRGELPRGGVETRMTELWAGLGVRVFNVPGHTWGQQAVAFEDERGRTIVFTPDVMPTVNHVGAAYSLAYDVEPYTSMISRRWFLTEAMERGWTLCLDHEPGNPFVKVKRAARGDWFDLEPVAV